VQPTIDASQPGKTILVVEDHDLLLFAMRDMLEAEDYKVVTATDGVDALDKMQSITPDLIIADISMPRMDGYTFFEEVHAVPAWVPIPFVFLTARAEQEDRLRGKALGAEDYIIKPFDPQELLVVVNSRIGRAQEIRAATATEFDDLKQQIITLLSHELRTPLTSVYGYTELALEEATGLPPGDFQQFLQGIKKGADRLTQLVEDLLMVVRLDSGELQREFDQLGSVQDGIMGMVRRAARAQAGKFSDQDVTIVVDVEEGLPPVLVHEYFVSDALARLVDNAVKFTRTSPKRIRLGARVDGDKVAIEVQDWGVGIAPDQMDRLFERFGQLNRHQMEQQGTGLGLVIAQELVRCMGGTITVASSRDEPSGSTFTILLPIANTA